MGFYNYLFFWLYWLTITERYSKIETHYKQRKGVFTMAVDFKHIDTPFMREYIETNAPQDKAWFKSVAYDMRKKKKAIDKSINEP